MGEPLNFVAGDEKLFKNYLRELLVILAIGRRGIRLESWRALRVAVDYLLWMRIQVSH